MKTIALAFGLALCAFSGLSTAGCSSSSDDETPVGTVQAGAYTIDVHQERNGVSAGMTSRFVLKVSSGGQPTSITGWIGVQSGDGSEKKAAVFDPGDGDFDDDVVSPSPIPAGSKFWIEVVTGDKTDVTSIAWAK